MILVFTFLSRLLLVMLIIFCSLGAVARVALVNVRFGATFKLGRHFGALFAPSHHLIEVFLFLERFHDNVRACD